MAAARGRGFGGLELDEKKATLVLIPFLAWLAGCGEPPEVSSRRETQAVGRKRSTAGTEQGCDHEATGTVARPHLYRHRREMDWLWFREVKVQVGDPRSMDSSGIYRLAPDCATARV